MNTESNKLEDIITAHKEAVKSPRKHIKKANILGWMMIIAGLSLGVVIYTQDVSNLQERANTAHAAQINPEAAKEKAVEDTVRCYEEMTTKECLEFNKARQASSQVVIDTSENFEEILKSKLEE